MNDTEKTKNETKAAGEDWAVLPFDEREDEERWDKLIAETDDLAKRAAAIKSNFDDETLIEDNSPDTAARTTEPSRKSEDDDIADMNPF